MITIPKPKTVALPLVLLVALASCGVSTSTTPVTTATSNTVAGAEVALTAGENIAYQYASLPRCGTGVPVLCSDQTTVDKIKSLDNTAYNAVKTAEANSSQLTAAEAAVQALLNVTSVLKTQ